MCTCTDKVNYTRRHDLCCLNIMCANSTLGQPQSSNCQTTLYQLFSFSLQHSSEFNCCQFRSHLLPWGHYFKRDPLMGRMRGWGHTTYRVIQFEGPVVDSNITSDNTEKKVWFQLNVNKINISHLLPQVTVGFFKDKPGHHLFLTLTKIQCPNMTNLNHATKHFRIQ